VLGTLSLSYSANLNDKGREFSLKRFKNRYGKAKNEALFNLICQWLEISHQTTKVKHPWTNGQAEIMIKIVKNQAIKIHHYQSPEEAIKDLKKIPK